MTAVPFQSTPSGGKATVSVPALRCGAGVSIHAFRGEGDYVMFVYYREAAYVSIHAFRGEGDEALTAAAQWIWVFQSTPSGGKATSRSRVGDAAGVRVSIHAFRGEGDMSVGGVTMFQTGFNPRLPGGRRLWFRSVF